MGQVSDAIEEVYRRIEANASNAVFIHVVPKVKALERAAAVEKMPKVSPLWGKPFVVKDNMDVEGLPTTAGCPAFSYTPKKTAAAVQKLLDAGAILVGKANLDQFATGLTGTRSAYGAVQTGGRSPVLQLESPNRLPCAASPAPHATVSARRCRPRPFPSGAGRPGRAAARASADCASPGRAP